MKLLFVHFERFLNIKLFLAVFHLLFGKYLGIPEQYEQILERTTQGTFLQK
jgi:hypothetical protein